jgi:hypothetical protein
MPNMSYCRFQNTLEDLYACYSDMEVTSREEFNARKKLVKLCTKLAEEYDWIAESKEPFKDAEEVDYDEQY